MNNEGIDMRFALTDVVTDGNLPADGVSFEDLETLPRPHAKLVEPTKWTALMPA